MHSRPYRSCTLGELLGTAAQRWPERTALVFDPGGERLSFAELDAQVNRLAHALRAHGVTAGDRVGVMAGNRPLFPIAWLALARLGAAMVPLNAGYREEDALHLLSHAGVQLVLCDAERAPLLQRLQARRPGLVLWIDARDGVADSESLPLRLQDQASSLPPVEVEPEALANVQFTSGTTGLPKGCMLSQAYWTRLGRMIADELLSLCPQDVLLTAQPFSYIDPQWNLAAALASGATLVVLERFRPSQFWAAVRRHDVSFFYCLGAMPAMLLAQAPSPDDTAHRLRLVMCSGIPPDRHVELEQRYGVTWREVYGTTETGADILVHAEDAPRLCGSGSIGHALPHRETRIADPEGRPLPSGATGELLLRGTGMMDGYYLNPEATAQAFRGGWYHTGDLACRAPGGELRIVGRLKDMVRRSGENVATAEVEQAIASHPEVLLCAVVGVPDALRGEELHAYVVPHAGRQPELLALARHLEPLLARFKIPRYWSLCSDLPRTPSERVAKHQLSAQAAYCLAQLDRAAG